MRCSFAFVTLLLAITPGHPASTGETGGGACPPATLKSLDWTVRGAGPLRLERILCHGGVSSPYTQTAPAVSPDGRQIAGYGAYRGLFAAPLGAGSSFRTYPVELGVSASFTGVGEAASEGAFQWSADSRHLWTAVQGRAERGGWATTPMRPARAAAGGELRPLPELRHGSGPLDGLWWIDGQGRALARFGTHGNYYRPTHEDKAPALAFVDASNGRTLETLLLKDLPLPAGAAGPGTHLRGLAATTLPDGRLRALMRFDQWVLWTQGERLKAIADPYPKLQNVGMTLTPDGSRVLLLLPLPTSTVCPRVPPCRVGPVVTGPVAALHDLRTGARLWTVSGRDQHGGGLARPAISPDGRYGFVPLPRLSGTQEFAVVSMKDGRLLQKVGTTADTRTALGFLRDGRTLWVSGNFGVTAFYKIRDR